MTRKAKVPKRLAGVKVPKALRRGLNDLARSQDGKTVLAEALVAAAGVVAAHEAQPGSRTREAAAQAAPKVKAKGRAALAEARSWADGGGALQDAARVLTDALQGRDESKGREDARPTEAAEASAAVDPVQQTSP
jgi:hypothetical protein